MLTAGPLHCKVNQAHAHMTYKHFVVEGVVAGEKVVPFLIVFPYDL